jgi:hypothetical protein
VLLQAWCPIRLAHYSGDSSNHIFDGQPSRQRPISGEILHQLHRTARQPDSRKKRTNRDCSLCLRCSSTQNESSVSCPCY